MGYNFNVIGGKMSDKISPAEKAVTEALQAKVNEYMGQEIQDLADDINKLTHLPFDECVVIVQAVVIKLTMKNKLILKNVQCDS